MSTRIYNNSAWQSPTSISVYDGSWRTVKVGYVYDTGTWRVVYPDPITPSITTIFAGVYGGKYEVNWEVRLINCDYVVAYLYSGTTQTNLLSTQTIEVDENSVVDTRIKFTGLANNTTYNMKLIGYSITENTVTVFSGAVTTINVIIPTGQITSIVPNPNLTSVQVNWTSTGQNDYEYSIWALPEGTRVAQVLAGNATDRSFTSTFQHLPNKQYRVDLRLYSTSMDSTLISQTYTAPNTPAPSYSNFRVTTSTCNSMTVAWDAQNYTSGTIEIWTTIATPERVPGKGSLVASHSFTSLSSRTFTGLSSSTQYAFTLILNGTTTVTSDYVGSFGSILPSLTGSTIAASVNAPTNFTASSDFYGKIASFTWTAATGNCTSVSGYKIEYKLNTSSTWSLLSDSIASNAVSFSAGGVGTTTFAPGRTYNFRIFAKSSAGDSATAATVNLTMNNNPYSIGVSGTNSIDTSSSSVLTAQLRNADSENVSVSGVTITWSFIGGINPPSGSSVSPTSATTDSSGKATTTFSSGNDDGTGTVYADADNLGPFGGGQRTMTVNLRTGQTVTLTGVATTKGVSFTNSVHSSSYSYTNTPGYPTVGSLESGDSYNNSQFDILTSRTRDSRPSITISGRTATTSNTTFLANPLVSMAIRSSRAGYTTVDGTALGVTAGVTINSTRAYQWQQSTDGGATWTSTFNANFSGQDTQTLSWIAGINSRRIRCQVTTSFSNGSSDVSITDPTNGVVIP